MIQKYFADIRAKIDAYNHIIEEHSVVDKTYSDEKGFIDGQLIFIDDSILEFSEVKSTEIQNKIKYRYHYRSSNNNLIFRYDNAKHFPDIATFPHHKHLPQNVISCKEPDINSVLGEVEKIILRSEIQ
jgi:hypothetical protein